MTWPGATLRSAIARPAIPPLGAAVNGIEVPPRAPVATTWMLLTPPGTLKLCSAPVKPKVLVVAAWAGGAASAASPIVSAATALRLPLNESIACPPCPDRPSGASLQQRLAKVNEGAPGNRSAVVLDVTDPLIQLDPLDDQL